MLTIATAPISAAFYLRPIYQREAFAFITRFHRHHEKPQGWLFGAAVIGPSDEITGVICVGRRTARKGHDVTACEATRVCTLPGIIVRNRKGKQHAASVCSMLYAAAWRAAKELGYRSMTTYLLADEPAITLRALKEQGWKYIGMTDGGEWDRPSRSRQRGKHPTGPKQVWRVVCDQSVTAMTALSPRSAAPTVEKTGGRR